MSIKERQQLDHIVSTIDSLTVWMAEALLDTECSQLFIPPFIKKLAAVKDNLEVVAAKINTYKAKNKEHDTALLKQRAMCMVDAARRQFSYLRKLLDMEPACVKL